jgi:hypothetical protein
MADYLLIYRQWNKSDASCVPPMSLIPVPPHLPIPFTPFPLTQWLTTGLLCDLLWSDPDKDITGWSENDRGVSFTFGPDVVSRFLQKHDLDLICRAHQVVEDGYEFFSKRQLVTLFSAPNYCGEFDNAGAMMSVDESLLCSFQVTPHTPSTSQSFPFTPLTPIIVSPATTEFVPCCQTPFGCFLGVGLLCCLGGLFGFRRGLLTCV